MIKILLDNDVDGFQELLAGAVESTGWSEFQLVEFSAGHYRKPSGTTPQRGI